MKLEIIWLILLTWLSSVIGNILSSDTILHFLANGWVILRSIYPTLNDPSLHSNLLLTSSILHQQFLNFSLLQFTKQSPQFSISKHFPKCGNEVNFLFLECLINQHNSQLPNQPNRQNLKPIQLPYYQLTNPHYISLPFYSSILNSSLPYLASQLLQYDRILLYQTALFEKDGKYINAGTAWHQDLNTVPLDTKENGHITFWCPLYPLHKKENDSLLVFASASHRDKSLLHWYCFILYFIIRIIVFQVSE